jgi:hypothetical protein
MASKPQGKRASKKEDVVLFHGLTEDGGGYHVVRKRDERIEFGAVRPLEEGRAIHGEVVRLVPRSESPLLFDAETTYEGTKATAHGETAGPAQVATEEYRSGWTKIWGKASTDRALN